MVIPPFLFFVEHICLLNLIQLLHVPSHCFLILETLQFMVIAFIIVFPFLFFLDLLFKVFLLGERKMKMLIGILPKQ